MSAAAVLVAPEIEKYVGFEKELTIPKPPKTMPKEQTQIKVEDFPISAICEHFEAHLSFLDNTLNAFAKACFDVAGKGKVNAKTVNLAYAVFSDLEDYVEFACADYGHFCATMKAIKFDKTKLKSPYRGRLDTVEARFVYLKEKFEREEAMLLGHLLSKCTKEERAKLRA